MASSATPCDSSSETVESNTNYIQGLIDEAKQNLSSSHPLIPRLLAINPSVSVFLDPSQISLKLRLEKMEAAIGAFIPLTITDSNVISGKVEAPIISNGLEAQRSESALVEVESSPDDLPPARNLLESTVRSELNKAITTRLSEMKLPLRTSAAISRPSTREKQTVSPPHHNHSQGQNQDLQQSQNLKNSFTETNSSLHEKSFFTLGDLDAEFKQLRNFISTVFGVEFNPDGSTRCLSASELLEKCSDAELNIQSKEPHPIIRLAKLAGVDLITQGDLSLVGRVERPNGKSFVNLMTPPGNVSFNHNSNVDDENLSFSSPDDRNINDNVSNSDRKKLEQSLKFWLRYERQKYSEFIVKALQNFRGLQSSDDINAYNLGLIPHTKGELNFTVSVNDSKVLKQNAMDMDKEIDAIDIDNYEAKPTSNLINEMKLISDQQVSRLKKSVTMALSSLAQDIMSMHSRISNIESVNGGSNISHHPPESASKFSKIMESLQDQQQQAQHRNDTNSEKSKNDNIGIDGLSDNSSITKGALNDLLSVGGNSEGSSPQQLSSKLKGLMSRIQVLETNLKNSGLKVEQVKADVSRVKLESESNGKNIKLLLESRNKQMRMGRMAQDRRVADVDGIALPSLGGGEFDASFMMDLKSAGLGSGEALVASLQNALSQSGSALEKVLNMESRFSLLERDQVVEINSRLDRLRDENLLLMSEANEKSNLIGKLKEDVIHAVATTKTDTQAVKSIAVDVRENMKKLKTEVLTRKADLEDVQRLIEFVRVLDHQLNDNRTILSGPLSEESIRRALLNFEDRLVVIHRGIDNLTSAVRRIAAVTVASNANSPNNTSGGFTASMANNNPAIVNSNANPTSPAEMSRSPSQKTNVTTTNDSNINNNNNKSNNNFNNQINNKMIDDFIGLNNENTSNANSLLHGGIDDREVERLTIRMRALVDDFQSLSTELSKVQLLIKGQQRSIDNTNDNLRRVDTVVRDHATQLRHQEGFRAALNDVFNHNVFSPRGENPNSTDELNEENSSEDDFDSTVNQEGIDYEGGNKISSRKPPGLSIDLPPSTPSHANNNAIIFNDGHNNGGPLDRASPLSSNRRLISASSSVGKGKRLLGAAAAEANGKKEGQTVANSGFKDMVLAAVSSLRQMVRSSGLASLVGPEAYRGLVNEVRNDVRAEIRNTELSILMKMDGFKEDFVNKSELGDSVRRLLNSHPRLEEALMIAARVKALENLFQAGGTDNIIGGNAFLTKRVQPDAACASCSRPLPAGLPEEASLSSAGWNKKNVSPPALPNLTASNIQQPSNIQNSKMWDSPITVSGRAKGNVVNTGGTEMTPWGPVTWPAGRKGGSDAPEGLLPPVVSSHSAGGSHSKNGMKANK